MVAHVTVESLCLARGELEVVQPDELSPTEAVAAIGVTGLAGGREEENRLAVLVLHPFQWVAVEGGHVEVHLPGGVGIQLVLDLSGSGEQFLARRVAPDHPSDRFAAASPRRCPADS